MVSMTQATTTNCFYEYNTLAGTKPLFTMPLATVKSQISISWRIHLHTKHGGLLSVAKQSVAADQRAVWIPAYQYDAFKSMAFSQTPDSPAAEHGSLLRASRKARRVRRQVPQRAGELRVICLRR